MPRPGSHRIPTLALCVAAVLAATNFSGQGLSNKLQLNFKCEELPNMDTFSQSDPFVVLYKQQG